MLWASGSAVPLSQWLQADQSAQASKTTFALGPAIAELQAERQQTIGWLASHGSRTDLDAQRQRTDAALAAFREADAVAGGDGSAQYLDALETVRTRLSELAAERAAVDGGKETRQHVYTSYSATVLAALNLFGTLSNPDGALAAEAGRAVAFFRATESLSQESAILAGATASGRLSAQERTDLTSASALRTYLLTNQVAPYLPADTRAALETVTTGQDWATLADFEASIPLTAGAEGGSITVPQGPAADAAVSGRVATALKSVQDQYLAVLLQDIDASTSALRTRLVMGSALALAAVLAIAVMSFRITRSLIGRMTSLRRATLELAQNRLPQLVTRLRTEGSRADLADLPELDYGSDELGRVADAFNTAQRTAVSVALEQAELREGARLVFLNMSLRTQVLLQRQLAVIDGMERKEQDPELLADIYRVDHLATRMRRNAESLTVLSGSTPRRRWKHAVPFTDVLRSAVSEIEGYARVVVDPMPPIAVTGPAVGDMIHLMAELIENGVTFSPPHTKVRVRGLPVAQGMAIEVEDRGLGLSAQEYATANDILRNPPEFSFTALGEDPRLGLFTAAHIARRHGVTVTLQPSSYCGATAVVVIPQSLTEPVADTAQLPLDTRADRHLAPVASPPPAGFTPSGMPTRTRRAPRPGTRPAPAAAGPTVAGPASGDAPSPTPGHRTGSGRLPRRVRQTHLAPQLLQRQADSDRSHHADEGAEERRPERARSMLAALQDGTRRARAQEDVPPPIWLPTMPDPATPERRRPPTRPRPTRNT
ncbi:HAMP domain-containing protein [Streptomyces sp. SID5914]|nr:nitrate- and nitrite sensing domain-containing protein [Streptomyces sp. SID5914]MZG17092.1 HAMP domain-containing protein [Streptomyces sp. SID5914]